ncbi:rabphilin-3A isoform X2 [Aethina tumida]|uniref:rabphilin-3A isoform X2 n=1 Tax=Aethina tumida TaxID=116153 RepID=UPI002148209E|nr:rabphilin-3A isoform X2 [Aethina tumida]
MVDCGSTDNVNKFVCPNDRQLALRAKLRTGWSMKTASLGFRSQTPKNQPLGPEEQETILQVIQRAERLDHSEQERVGKLVERLENMRRNALGRNASQCLLCGDSFGLMGAHKVVCIDCRRLACQKCAIIVSPSKSSGGPKDQWLCMICSETREIWKKSGAWFFKSLPKYILPSDNSSLTRHRPHRMSRNSRGVKEEDSSSDEEKRVWNRIKRRNSSTESTHDIQESQPSYSRQGSSADTQSYKEMDQLKSYMGSMTLSHTKSWDNAVMEGRSDVTSGDSSEASRRESMASRSASECYWTDNTRSDEKVSPSACSVSSSIFKNSVEESGKIDSAMGTIELSLTYDAAKSVLHCTVYRAKNLIPMDIAGLSDPFCKLNILPTAKTSTRLRTKTVHKTRNPEFNEHLAFYDVSEDDLMKKSLHVLVVDDDRYGHDYMGEVRIHLAKLRIQKTIYLTTPLENFKIEQKGPVPLELNQWFDDDWSRGQILLSLGYSTKRRALLVTVIRCANLLPMDNNGLSDPFVKLQLRPDPYHRKHKSSIKWKNLNPVFNEEFAFETRPTELYTQSLYITVFDKDYGKSNDYLGGLILGGTGSKGQRLKHWLDMIRYPDHRHEQWHNLTEDVLD